MEANELTHPSDTVTIEDMRAAFVPVESVAYQFAANLCRALLLLAPYFSDSPRVTVTRKAVNNGIAIDVIAGISLADGAHREVSVRLTDRAVADDIAELLPSVWATMSDK